MRLGQLEQRGQLVHQRLQAPPPGPRRADGRGHVQQFGRPEPRQEQALKAGLRTALREPNLPASLRDWMTRLEGTLRPDDRTTGDRLRDYVP
jgi:hypothetical protein